MRISVIIPVYNVAAYVGECMDSVLSAWRRARECGVLVEVICVDDGSNDGSGEILDGYGKMCDHDGLEIVVIHQRNGGVSCARNAALHRMTGDWVLFVDADDRIYPEMFVCLSDTISTNPAADVISFNYSRVQTDFFARPEMSRGGGVVVTDVSKSLSSAIIWQEMWQNCFRRDVLPHDGFGPYAMGEDLLLLTESLCQAKLHVKIPDYLYWHRLRIGSAERSRDSQPRILDMLLYTSRRLRALMMSGKRVAPSTYRLLGGKLTENAVWRIFHLPRTERDSAWNQMLAILDDVPQAVPFGWWQRFVMAMMIYTRSEMVAYILCYLPTALKKKGFHR